MEKVQLSLDFSVVEQIPSHIPLVDALQHSNPCSGWINEYFVTRCRKKHGPYFSYCYRIDGKIRHIYVSKVKLPGVKFLIAENASPSKIIKFIRHKLT